MFTLGWGLQAHGVECIPPGSNLPRVIPGPCWRYLERVPYYVSSVLPNCTESKYLYVCKWRPRMVNASISLASSIQTDGFDNQMVEKIIFLPHVNDFPKYLMAKD